MRNGMLNAQAVLSDVRGAQIGIHPIDGALCRLEARQGTRGDGRLTVAAKGLKRVDRGIGSVVRPVRRDFAGALAVGRSTTRAIKNGRAGEGGVYDPDRAGTRLNDRVPRGMCRLLR